MRRKQPDRLIRVHVCDTMGRRLYPPDAWTIPTSMVPLLGDGVQTEFKTAPRLHVRRRLWLNWDEVELHCREVCA